MQALGSFLMNVELCMGNLEGLAGFCWWGLGGEPEGGRPGAFGRLCRLLRTTIWLSTVWVELAPLSVFLISLESLPKAAAHLELSVTQ